MNWPLLTTREFLAAFGLYALVFVILGVVYWVSKRKNTDKEEK